MKMTKKFFAALLAVVAMCLCYNLHTFAANTTLSDGKVTTKKYVTSYTLNADFQIDAVYIEFFSQAVDFTVTDGEKTKYFAGEYLQTYADISDFESPKTVTVTFSQSVGVCELVAIDKENIPKYVKRWNAPYEKTDMLLCTTHADDEQLFFAGILPLYAIEKGYRVQVVYFVNHNDNPKRNHELLNGLWEVGITHYPVISNFPDAYSESYEGAIKNFEAEGFTENDLIEFQVEMLRRFKPQVVIGHDLNGEYGHGQHIANTKTLIAALDKAKDSSIYPEATQKYGIWSVKKLYLHLYDKNKVVLPIDQPLESLGGKTSFQVTQAGFEHHESQHWTWFKKWLTGTNGEITKSSQIKTYTPGQYGLYYTAVGQDTLKNDLFENIVSYDEQERIAEQEAIRKEEERKKQEAEKQKLEAANKSIEDKAKKTKTVIPVITCSFVLIATISVMTIVKYKKRMVKK